MKALMVALLILILLPFPVFADDSLTAYHLQNTTINLLSLNQKVIDFGMGLVFSEEEQKELKGIVNNETSLEIIKTQEILIESGKVEKPKTDDCYGQKALEESYSRCKEAQEFVSMEDTFRHIDFLLRKCLKIEESIEQFLK
ncbi:hypothetical protein M0R01_02580 [bacterium]|nr:hypothetical protein [bacterium]